MMVGRTANQGGGRGTHVARRSEPQGAGWSSSEALLLAMDKSVPRLDAIAHHLSLMTSRARSMRSLGGISDQIADIGDELLRGRATAKLREWGNEIDMPEKAHWASGAASVSSRWAAPEPRRQRGDCGPPARAPRLRTWWRTPSRRTSSWSTPARSSTAPSRSPSTPSWRWRREGDGARPAPSVVTGCLSQRYDAELRREIPEIDATLGTGQVGRHREGGGRRDRTSTRAKLPTWVYDHAAPASSRRRRLARLREDQRGLRLPCSLLHHPHPPRAPPQPQRRGHRWPRRGTWPRAG